MGVIKGYGVEDYDVNVEYFIYLRSLLVVKWRC